MNTAPDGQGKDWHNTAKDGLETPTVDRRRLLYGGAAGGLVLVASGLLVPEQLIEKAEADTHPVSRVQHRAAQRRKREHRRHHRHNRRRHDDSTKPPGLGLKGIRLTVINETDFTFQVCRFWAGTISWNPKWENLTKRGSRLSSFTEDTEDLHAGVVFSEEKAPFVWVENPIAGLPNTTYQYGGSMSPFGYRGGTVDVDHGTLEEGAETTHRIPFKSSSTYAIKVRRETDIPGFKVFTITILPS